MKKFKLIWTERVVDHEGDTLHHEEKSQIIEAENEDAACDQWEKENEHNEYQNGLDDAVEVIETPLFDKKIYLDMPDGLTYAVPVEIIARDRAEHYKDEFNDDLGESLREDTIPFLEALKASGKQRILLTNAHPHNLAVKLEHTGLDAHLDLLLSTHTFGYPKEDQRLWHAVAEATGLKAERTLFIDDSEAILDAAAQFGIRYCLGVTNPDSGIAEKQYQRHPSLNDYRRLIPSLM